MVNLQAIEAEMVALWLLQWGSASRRVGNYDDRHGGGSVWGSKLLVVGSCGSSHLKPDDWPGPFPLVGPVVHHDWVVTVGWLSMVDRSGSSANRPPRMVAWWWVALAFAAAA